MQNGDAPKYSERRIPALGKSKYGSVNTLIHHSFSSNGPALYNTVPTNIKAITSLEPFKAHLDKWLKSFPDTPPTPGYVAANRNSVVDWANSKSN